MLNKNKIASDILKELYLQKKSKKIEVLTAILFPHKYPQKDGYFFAARVFGTQVKKFYFCDSQKNYLQLKKYTYLFNKHKTELFKLNQGFLIRLILVGVGYKANVKDSALTLRLGRVLDDIFVIPKNIFIFVVRLTQIYIFGINKVEVSQVADKIRKLKSPDVFQGKGILYYKEKLILKESKKKK